MKTIKEYLLANYELEDLKDIATHGCVTGCAGTLIYYTDTCAFHDKYEEEIWSLLESEYADLGYKTIFEFIGSLNGAKNIGCLDHLKNLLCWYSVEEIARDILADKGIEV